MTPDENRSRWERRVLLSLNTGICSHRYLSSKIELRLLADLANGVYHRRRWPPLLPFLVHYYCGTFLSLRSSIIPCPLFD